MGYQALLFCPDEKTARTVTLVLSELDFAVTPCTEPFAAVKKLMAEHFDAVVVDCDNEQNATLLFKSARNTINNQSSLAVAVVEGQAGVAKAFRIGANLVLTKPINVEQAKGTLRVARGLLRKNEAAKPATAATSAKPAPVSVPPAQTTISRKDTAHPPAPATFSVASETPSNPLQKSARAIAAVPTASNETSAELFEGTSEEMASRETAKPATPPPHAPEIASSSSGPGVDVAASRPRFGMSAASAPAPAREPNSTVSTDNKPSPALSEPETAGTVATRNQSTTAVDGPSALAPMFTFGGTLSTGDEPASGGSKKLLWIVAAVVLIAAGSFAAWMEWGRPNENTNVPAPVVEAPVKTSAAIPQAPPSQPSVAKSSTSDPQPTASVENVQTHPGKVTASIESSKPSPSAVVTNKAPATKQDAEPIVIKNNPSRPAVKSVEAPAPPSMAGIAPAGNDGGLPNLMDSQSTAPAPVLQTLSVSQGVSQGLLVNRVQPKYPQSALRLRVEGAVQLLATISKTGDISVVKILSGDPQLSHAAVEAVKQWKYKPYLLNGSPVEIQTQITVNFKLPN